MKDEISASTATDTSCQEIDISDFVVNSIDIKDYAFNKKVIELCNHPNELTSIKAISYNGTSGYSATHCPSYITIDLGEDYGLGLIQFLLMDLPIDTNHGIRDRRYYFRVLVSRYDYSSNDILDKDDIEWRVVYDSGSNGYRNWQFIRLSESMSVRFIRIHCLHNDKNSGFHIVRLRAYSKIVNDNLDIDKLKERIREIDNHGLAQVIDVDCSSIIAEIGDGFPLSRRIYDIASMLKQVGRDKEEGRYLQLNIDRKYLSNINQRVTSMFLETEDKKYINVSHQKLWLILASVADDIATVEKNSDGTQRMLLDPVSVNIKKSNWWNFGLAIANIAVLLAFLIVSLSTGALIF